MNGWRGVSLLAAAVPLLTVLGVGDDETASACRRVLIAAVALWLAPLFWPGAAAHGRDTVWRVLGWSLAVTGVAALAMLWLASGRGAPASLLPILSLLLALLSLAHALAARAQAWMQRRGQAEAQARQVAGQVVSLCLLVLGALPLAGGPLAQVLWQHGHSGLLDILMAASPLTHLAVAAEFDLLRADWLYRNSNLSALPVAYPDPKTLALAYGLACAALAVPAWIGWRRGPARILA